jgi:hypothetical protein
MCKKAFYLPYSVSGTDMGCRFDYDELFPQLSLEVINIETMRSSH